MGGTSSRNPIDEWEIVQGIGTGTFGAVMAVKKLNASKEDVTLFAMKCIDKREVLERKSLAGTMAEMQLMARMSFSPFVLKLHYAFQDSATLYLVTDLCEGGSLDQLVRKETILKEDAAVILFAELVLAIEHLHKLGIIHMDIKLANCLLDIYGHLKLADFNGAVKFSSSRAKFTENSYFGTSGYLCPEILVMETGFVVCSPDWWSVGICFWTMLHGKRASPWLEKRRKFRSWEQELQVIVSKRRPNIGQHVSQEAADIISKLLRLDWKSRMGCGERGAKEVKDHKLFAHIDWKRLEDKDIEPIIRPQALAFSEENSEKTADSLQSNILHEPLLSEQQQLFKPWDYSIDLASQPEFSVLNKFASMDLKRGRHFVTKCSDTELEMLITDVRKLQNLWMEENQELAVAQNMVDMLKGENFHLKEMVRQSILVDSPAADSKGSSEKKPTESGESQARNSKPIA
ncbi:hypothetical protein AAMO2058_001715200 [Amorphochlora amoebiformis]